MDNFYYSSDSFQGSLRITPKYLWNLSLYMHKLWVKMYETLAKANSIYLSIYIEKLVGILRSFKVQSLILFLFWRRHQYRCVAPPPFFFHSILLLTTNLPIHPSPSIYLTPLHSPFSFQFILLFTTHLSPFNPFISFKFILLILIHTSHCNSSFSFQPILLRLIHLFHFNLSFSFQPFVFFPSIFL